MFHFWIYIQSFQWGKFYSSLVTTPHLRPALYLTRLELDHIEETLCSFYLSVVYKSSLSHGDLLDTLVAVCPWNTTEIFFFFFMYLHVATNGFLSTDCRHTLLKPSFPSKSNTISPRAGDSSSSTQDWDGLSTAQSISA